MGLEEDVEGLAGWVLRELCREDGLGIVRLRKAGGCFEDFGAALGEEGEACVWITCDGEVHAVAC